MVLRRLAFLLAPEVFAELEALKADRADLIQLQRRREERLRAEAEDSQRARRLAEEAMGRESERCERELERRREECRRLMEYLWNRLSRNEQKVIAALVRNGNDHLTASEIIERTSFTSREQVTRVTRDLSNMGLLRICLHGPDGERCFTLGDDELVGFVREKVARFDERLARRGAERDGPSRPAALHGKGQPRRRRMPPGRSTPPERERSEEPWPRQEEGAAIRAPPSRAEPPYMVPAELSARGSEPEPSFEEDVGYRFDFAPAAAFAGGRR